MRKKRVGIGIVGMGFMGTTHLLGARKLRGGKVVGIVTTDPRKARGDFRHVRGNFGDGGGKIPLDGLSVHPTMDSLLEDERVELVDVCLPSYLHAAAAVRCLEAGRHVMVEKPVALEPAAARRMLAVARKTGKLLLVAQVLKFFPEFALIASAIGDGRWGRLLALHLFRRISAPDWGERSWFSDPAKSGGMVIDLHIHDTDFIVHLFGKPAAVSSEGLLRDGRVDFIRTVYRGAVDGPLVTSEAGWVNSPGLPFAHGYDVFFEGATLHFDSSRSAEPILYGAKGPKPLRIPRREAFHDEIEEAVRAVETGEVPARLSASSALLSLEVCLAEEKSVRTRKLVKL